jgi:thiamine biosynthesis lipoprotein
MKRARLSSAFFAGVISTVLGGALSQYTAWASSCESVERLPSMGTVFELQLVTSCDPETRSALVLAAQKRLDTIETSMSLYQSESEISRLNRLRAGESLQPSADFRAVLEASLKHAKLTNGYFDITVWPALRTIQMQVKDTGQPPNEAQLAQLRQQVDYRNVRLGKGEVGFSKDGTQISTDGIAKGYAVDEVARLFDQSGVRAYLLNFSGNMKLRGTHLDGKPWKVAILNPVDQSSTPAKLRSGDSIASSGVDFNHYTADKKWHHLIDPKTLHPADRVVGASVIGPSATVCDALSTAAFVMGPKLTRKVFARNYPGYRFWMVDAKNQVFTNAVPSPSDRKNERKSRL